ncbi:MAG: hypothetical protein HXL62_04095 [Streptococcus sp.]|nr:hypothetical protein [Streptococcus sp.]
MNLDIACLGLDVRPGCADSVFDVSFKASRFTTTNINIASFTCSESFVFVSKVTNSTTN